MINLSKSIWELIQDESTSAEDSNPEDFDPESGKDFDEGGTGDDQECEGEGSEGRRKGRRLW